MFYSLAKLTSITKKNTKTKIDERYQGQAKELSKAGMAPKIYLTMRDIWKKADASKLNNDAKWENRIGRRERTTYFV